MTGDPMIEGLSFGEYRKTKYRCTKGHEWEIDMPLSVTNYAPVLVDPGDGSPPRKYCLRCFVALADKYIGQVERVEEVPSVGA